MHPSTTKTAYELLGATLRTNTLPFLILINWTGLVVKTAPPVSFHLLKFPFRACKQTFFPQHPASLIQPPVAEWSDPHGPEQACLNELSLAELCRHTSFGHIAMLILRKRQAAYRMLNHPWNLIQLHTPGNRTQPSRPGRHCAPPHQRGLRLCVHVYKNSFH